MIEVSSSRVSILFFKEMSSLCKVQEFCLGAKCILQERYTLEALRVMFTSCLWKRCVMLAFYVLTALFIGKIVDCGESNVTEMGTR